MVRQILTTTSAFYISFSFAAAYVGGLYLSKNARVIFASVQHDGDLGMPREKQKDELWRDDPTVIRARIVVVTFAALACCLGVFAVLWLCTDLAFHSTLYATLRHLGFFPPGPLWPVDMSSAHLVTPILFIGPLFGSYLDGQLPGQRNWNWNTHVHLRFFTIQGFRNYCVGPATEEVVFRACVLAIYHLAGASKMRMIFLTPLSFALAHVHHAWGTYNRYGRNAAAVNRAIISSVYLLSYTTLFGIHASYLFLRTGSVWPPITAHIFCNIMGVPQIDFELRKFPEWKSAIIRMYLAGIFGYVYTLTRWTKTPGNLYWPSDGYDMFVHRKY